MKRIAVIFLIILVFLCSCNSKNSKVNNKAEEIIINEETENGLDDYKLTSNIVSQVEEKTESDIDKSSGFVSKTYKAKQKKSEEKFDGVYFANKNSKKFHKSTCSFGKKIKSENLHKTKDRENLIDSGYVPCLKCNP
ncbi:MAG: hypothetical protein MJ090_05105 [Clostridia bacterium]|nr:hypothetical protein [Clostridia bacterium]